MKDQQKIINLYQTTRIKGIVPFKDLVYMSFIYCILQFLKLIFSIRIDLFLMKSDKTSLSQKILFFGNSMSIPL